MLRALVLLALAPFAGSAFAIVNVNTAQQSELQKARGLDRYKAKAIIEYRAQNGPIASLEDLEKVPGLTPQVVEKAAPDLAFSGPPFKPSPKVAPEKKNNGVRPHS